MYDYIQTRVAEKRKEAKYLNIISPEEAEAIKQLQEKEMKEQTEKVKAMVVGAKQ